MTETTKPTRIQRQRTKGWRMPANTVYVGRPTTYGNPWLIDAKYYGSLEAARHGAVAMYRGWMTGFYCDTFLPRTPDVAALRGKDLACWCPVDQPCHADVLLEIANA